MNNFDQYNVMNHPVVGTEPASSSHYEGTARQPHLSCEDDDCATNVVADFEDDDVVDGGLVQTITAKGPSRSW